MTAGITEMNPIELMKASGGYICCPRPETRYSEKIDSRIGEVPGGFGDCLFTPDFCREFSPDAVCAQPAE